MSWTSRILAMTGALSLSIGTLAAAQRPDPVALAAIRAEALSRSQVMDHIGWLSDVYGPRVTGSPAIEQAREWAMERLRSWGVSNVREERFSFGRGWSLVRFHAHMVEPQVMPIIGYPKSWSSSTSGTVTAEAVRIDIRTPADFDRLRGTLRGKIVLPQPEREVRMLEGDLVLRMTDAQLAEAAQTQVPSPAATRPNRGRVPFSNLLQEF